MNGARERILARINAALAQGPGRDATLTPGAPVVSAQALRPLGNWELFAERLAAVHGEFLPAPAALSDLVRREGWQCGYCDPGLLPWARAWLPEGVELATTIERSQIDRYQFGVTRGEGVIAETGTVVLADRSTPERLGALAPWAHVAVVGATSIWRTVAEAAAQLPPDRNVIWVTGPSKTADVEGILIEGVHGPGLQAVLRWPENEAGGGLV